MLDPTTIEQLRAVLKPRRERFDFAYTMNRWAELALDGDPSSDPRSERSDARPIEGPFSWLEDGADLVTELTGKLRKGPPPPIKRGRPRVDRARHAALLLGHIFQEYVESQPTRVWDAIEDREVSRFYRFATTAFEAIGLEPSKPFEMFARRGSTQPKKSTLPVKQSGAYCGAA
jgi:hypothetical protein